MFKKVSHIILSLLIVVSTTGLTYTKHFCNAQSLSNAHLKKAEHVQQNHSHNFISKNHNAKHAQMQMDECMDDDMSCTDDTCCENETCHDDNCCNTEIQTIKLSLDYIKIESKESFKIFEIELLSAELIVFHNLFNESSIISKYLIADSPTKIKNTQSFLQSFRC